MAHHEEPMDVDCMDGDFDNKENSYHLSNVLPCTEKGYEELDVSELNMKLRYSITPAASPMSRSYTACIDRNLDSDDSLNRANENANLTRSLNSTMTKNDSVIKSLKAMPLQSISTEHVVDNRGSVLRQLDSTITCDNNVTITIGETNDINENLSLPSSSSSALHTPEATTPTNITKNEEVSPIMRGLKSVFNMFRSSQSPIPPVENEESVKQKVKDLDPDETYCEDKQPTISSTPISAHRSRDGSSKRSSPLKESIIFNDDLEKELLWKDDTILFSEEKIPIHKLFLPQNKLVPLALTASFQKDQKPIVDNTDSTDKCLDVSLNNSVMLDNTLTETHNNTNAIESDGEFLDCETTFTKNESVNVEAIEESLEILTKEVENKIVAKVAISEEKKESTPQILDITREIVAENDSTLNEIIESQDVPLSDADKTLDFNNGLMHVTEVNENKLSNNEEVTPVYETVIAEVDVSSASKSNETDISLDHKADDVEHKSIEARHNVVEDKSLQENLTKSIVIENLNVSNEMNSGEITFEVDIKLAEPESYQVMENEKNCKEVKDIQNMCIEPTKDVHLDTKVECIEQNACSTDNASDTITNVCLTSVPEHNNLVAPNDFHAKSEDVQFSPCNLLVEEPANVPLPDNDDFDIDLDQNKHETETIQIIPPDVLDSVIAELKHDATVTQSNILDDTNITENAIAEINTLPVSEKQDILNETNDIVNSLTEIIGESQNNTIIRSECLLDQSQNDQMEGIEYTEEIHVLPDLVNETIHNMSVDINTANVPALMNQPGPVIETIDIGEMHDMLNVPEKKPDATEQNKLIFETKDSSVAKITTEVSNDSINENKEQLNAIVETYENIDTAPKSDSKINACDEPRENKVLDDNFVPNTEVNDVPIIDEELVLSENNSPYVSVISEKEPQPTEELFENIDIPRTTTNVAPSSPPIRSRGYNFNFDEMDDPFATKTKIRLSPPASPSKLIEPDSENKNKTGASKKGAPNRRRSQPPERKRPAFNKKKFNTTLDAALTDTPTNISNDHNSDGDSKKVAVVTLENTTITTDIDNVVDKEVALILDSTQVLENVQSAANLISAADIECEINADDKLSTESISATTSEIKTNNSSSEQSTYYSAAASSSDSSISKNVFNIPEIDDKNFNPFATKSKMRQSPPLNLERENPIATIHKPSFDSSTLAKENTPLSTLNIVRKDDEDKMDTELMEKDSSYNVSNITPSSNSTDDKNITIREVNTEDEDTEEGPFLEAEDAIDKLLGIDDDMMQFNEITAQTNEENADGGELFIDAEAFEFLLNKNQSNVVTDSGKESLFLKFDPLFAKRISSDGVLAALNKVQKRQSTPTKPTRPSLRNEASPIAGPSTLNATYDEEANVTQDSIEDLNVTVAKPMMVVTPAVNPAVTPRNKTTTPPRSNRRSITFTSPAMAVIDRLLSLSANNSLLGHDTTITQNTREHIEADIALSQLRELLAEKEISVYQLRSESKELKDRLSTMETQVKILEADGQERLNKINELNDRLAEKTKVNKSMAAVVEEYERTIASLIAETEQDKKRHAEERIKLINERDEQTAHLASMEVSFSDLHSKYEKSKQVILSCKANEETCKKSIKDFESNLTKMQANYEMLKQHATSKLNHANQELQKMNKSHESEVLKLNAMIKRKEMHITSLEETLAQKTKANEELTAICDELINKVG